MLPRRLLSFACVVSLALLNVAPCHAEEKVAITPDIVYGHKDGLALTIDLFQPVSEANGAAVLFMISGGWYSRWAPPEQTQRFLQPLLDKGFTVFSVRHGSSPRYVIPEIVEDVRRSVRFVRSRAKQFNIDPDRIGVLGGSAGGHLALMLGVASDPGDAAAQDTLAQTSDRVAAVVAYFPPTDIRPFVDEKSPYYQQFPALQFDPAKASDYSPLLHVSSDDPPTLLVHGDQDKLVPIKHSHEILAALEKEKVPCELVVIEGAAHGFKGADNERAASAMVSWFEKHLGAK